MILRPSQLSWRDGFFICLRYQVVADIPANRDEGSSADILKQRLSFPMYAVGKSSEEV